MLKQIFKQVSALVKSNKKPDQGFVGIDDNWYTADIKREWICHECAGGENEPPEMEPVYIEDLEEASLRIEEEHEEEEKKQDAEWELINESDVEEEWKIVN